MNTTTRADATTPETKEPARPPHIVTPESLIRPRDICGDAFIFREPEPSSKNATWNTARGLFAILSWRRPFDSNGEEVFAQTYLDSIPGMTQDGFQNRHLTIPYASGDPCNVIWSCHIDTCHHDEGYQRLAICKDENDLDYIRVRRGEGNCLGADDGTGVWLMLEMIRARRPGRYIFHRGEERGCQGSRWIVANDPHLLDGATAAIALDRRDFANIITHQGGERGCSEAFAESIAAQLPGFKADPTGLFTDTKQYFRKIPECTNLSVGYQSQHGPLERQYVSFAVSMRDALLTFDTTRLTIARDPQAYEYQNRTYERPPYAGGHQMRGRYRSDTSPNDSGNDPGNINPDHYIHRASGGNQDIYVWSKKTSRNILRINAVFIIGDGYVTFDSKNATHKRARATAALTTETKTTPTATVSRLPAPAAEDKDDSISPENELFDLQLEIDMERDLGQLCFAYPTAAAKLLADAGIATDDMLQMVYGDYLDDADAIGDGTADDDADEDAGRASQADTSPAAEHDRCVTIIGPDNKPVRVTAAEAMRLLDKRRADEAAEDAAPPPTELARARAVANGLVQSLADLDANDDADDDAFELAEAEAMARAFTNHTE